MVLKAELLSIHGVGHRCPCYPDVPEMCGGHGDGVNCELVTTVGELHWIKAV